LIRLTNHTQTLNTKQTWRIYAFCTPHTSCFCTDNCSNYSLWVI